jgi:peptidyl-prolyl cis-trans isomerase D
LEKSIEDAASSLKQGEVSNPVKSAFGYHLIKVTELIPGEVKAFDAVKVEVTKAYQKNQAENAFYEAGQRLTEMSYENPDNLKAAAEALGLTIKKSALFTKDKGEGIAADEKVRGTAFSEEVLHGNNSAPIELGADRLVVVRLLEHKAAAARDLKDVKQDIVAALQTEKASRQAVEKATQIKTRLQAGESIQNIATENKLSVKTVAGLTRSKEDVPMPLSQAIFKAAKPVGGKPTVFIVELPAKEQVVVSLKKVAEGVMTDDDKKKLDLATKNIAKAFGQTELTALVNGLQAEADVKVKASK